MPYPSKLTSAAILAAALELLRAGGAEAISMRPLAAALGVRPSSLYRYYGERDELIRALETEAFHGLQTALSSSVRLLVPAEALVAAAHAYRDFARREPHLYALLLAPEGYYTAAPGPGKDLWNTVLALVGAVTGDTDDTAATVAFWAFLHGFVQLERSGQFGLSGPQGGFETGLGALLVGFQARALAR